MGLFYRIQGSGEPNRVFLHGFLESSSMWKYLRLDSLPGTNVFIDLPGHGQSDLTSIHQPSIHYMMQEIRSVLDNIGILNYHIIGHSMGGYVALELKKNDPRCEKVILLNSNFWPDSEEKKVDRVRVAEIVLKAKRKFLQEAIPGLFLNPQGQKKEIGALLEEAEKMDESAIAFASLAMRNREDNRALLQENPNDFLIIQGKEDPVVPVAMMLQELENLPIAMETLSPCGHMAHIEQTDVVLSLLNGFLA